MSVDIEDIFDLGVVEEVQVDVANLDFDFFCKEDLPRWMVEKYYRWDEMDRQRRCIHVLPWIGGGK